jgi:hypothetical protein
MARHRSEIIMTYFILSFHHTPSILIYYHKFVDASERHFTECHSWASACTLITPENIMFIYFAIFNIVLYHLFYLNINYEQNKYRHNEPLYYIYYKLTTVKAIQ